MGKLTLTGCGFAGKGTKILGHWGSKGIRHCEERSDEAISLKLQASVQRNVAIASNRDLREQNTECAVRRCNDVVGAVSIHSNVRFSSCSFAINGPAREKLTVFPFRPQLTHAFFGSFSFFLHHNKKKEMNKKRDCFATLAMTGKKAFAFTLSEVLIVLAVLGVIAALTIPDLIQDYREKALITALKKNYSIFSQAVDMAVAENGAPSTWNFGAANDASAGQKLFDILKPYLRIEKECGTTKIGCFATKYKVLGGGIDTYWQPDTWHTYAKGILVGGASFHTYWNGGSNASGMIGVDVNGKAGPNENGVDYFWFIILPDGVLEPFGKSYIVMAALAPVCKYNLSNVNNGFGCTYWVIKNENMDYLRKKGNLGNQYTDNWWKL